MNVVIIADLLWVGVRSKYLIISVNPYSFPSGKHFYYAQFTDKWDTQWLCEAVELPLVENRGTWHFSISRPWSCSFASKVLYWGWDKNKGKWGSQQDLFSFISRDERSEKLGGNFVQCKIIVSYLIGLSDRNKTLKIIRTDVILGRQWIGKKRLRKDLESMCSFQTVLGGWDPQETSRW